jgi:hypothetical protein
MFDATLLLLEAGVLVDKLRMYNPLDNDRIVNSLKKSFVNFSKISREKNGKVKRQMKSCSGILVCISCCRSRITQMAQKAARAATEKEMDVVATLISVYGGKPLHLSFWHNRPRQLQNVPSLC